MHRIDGPGATITELFTEGNPSLGIPATTITDDWMNDVQENLAVFIEAHEALSKNDSDQLTRAINSAIGLGGTQLSQSVNNNEGTPQDVTGVLIDKVDFKAAKLEFDLHRQTDSSNTQEIGTVYLSHDTADDAWRISLTSVLDDAGVTFSVTAAGQLQYVSTNIAGANYASTLKITGITKFNQ